MLKRKIRSNYAEIYGPKQGIGIHAKYNEKSRKGFSFFFFFFWWSDPIFVFKMLFSPPVCRKVWRKWIGKREVERHLENCCRNPRKRNGKVT